MNYFEFYAGDYMRDTAELSLAEHGAYLLLMASYYSSERPLPADLAALHRIARAMNKAEQACVASVAIRFFPVDVDGLRHNARADREIAKAQRRINSAKENGKNGGRPSKAKPNPEETQPVSNGFDSCNPPETGSGEAPHAPPVKQKIPPTAAQSDDPLKLMIDGAIAYMAECGIAPQQARSVIGLVRKTVANDLVASEILASMQQQRIAAPIAWLRQTAESRKPGATYAGTRSRNASVVERTAQNIAANRAARQSTFIEGELVDP